MSLQDCQTAILALRDRQDVTVTNIHNLMDLHHVPLEKRQAFLFDIDKILEPDSPLELAVDRAMNDVESQQGNV